jgi:hypothetical protein
MTFVDRTAYYSQVMPDLYGLYLAADDGLGEVVAWRVRGEWFVEVFRRQAEGEDSRGVFSRAVPDEETAVELARAIVGALSGGWDMGTIGETVKG